MKYHNKYYLWPKNQPLPMVEISNTCLLGEMWISHCGVSVCESACVCMSARVRVWGGM